MASLTAPVSLYTALRTGVRVQGHGRLIMQCGTRLWLCGYHPLGFISKAAYGWVQAGFDNCFWAFQIRDRNRYDLHSLLSTLHFQMGELSFMLHNQSQVTQPPTSLTLAQPHLANHCHLFMTISKTLKIMSTPWRPARPQAVLQNH